MKFLLSVDPFHHAYSFARQGMFSISWTRAMWYSASWMDGKW